MYGEGWRWGRIGEFPAEPVDDAVGIIGGGRRSVW